MRLFYIVGGPTAGNEEAFGRRLAELGRPPRGWQVYPFADVAGGRGAAEEGGRP